MRSERALFGAVFFSSMDAKAREKELRRLQSCREELVASVPQLIAALDDPEASVRWTAVEVCGKLPEEELIKLVPLVETRIGNEESVSKRETATQAPTAFFYVMPQSVH